MAEGTCWAVKAKILNVSNLWQRALVFLLAVQKIAIISNLTGITMLSGNSASKP